MNPYKNLPKNAFWKLAVAQKNLFEIEDLWDPKFNIQKNDKIVSYGSCFAQHIGRALQTNGFNWLITEPPPSGLSESEIQLYSYKLFPARTGNIYTTSLLKQWTEWAFEKREVPDETWEKSNRFFDPFRPLVEPNGFGSIEELQQSQSQTIKSFRESLVEADYFVFTLGLTESWIHKTGYEYPMCPGTIAGEFDAKFHKFFNQQFNEVRQNLQDSMNIINDVNPKVKFLLTVSPVPLTASMSTNHVLIATMESKSILRAVAGELSQNNNYIDYFPSYEIINSPVYRGVFFESNFRNIGQSGVNFVMTHFFDGLSKKHGTDMNYIPDKNSKIHSNVGQVSNLVSDKDMEVCEEALLESFGN